MPVIDIEDATPADREAVLALLADAGLPAAGLEQHFANAIVARRDGAVVGSAALEIYRHGALLRSVAVAAAERGTGLGVRLTEAAIARARARHVPALYLLTTTAEPVLPALRLHHNHTRGRTRLGEEFGGVPVGVSGQCRRDAETARGLGRQLDRKHSAALRPVGGADAAAVQLDEMPHDRQSRVRCPPDPCPSRVRDLSTR